MNEARRRFTSLHRRSVLRAVLAAGAVTVLAACSAADSRQYEESQALNEMPVDWRENSEYIVRSVTPGEVNDFLREARSKGWSPARVERDPATPDRLLVTLQGRGERAIPADRDYSMTQGVPTSGPGMPPAEKHFVKTRDLPDRTARLQGTGSAH